MKCAIVGGSAAGSFAALIMARAGHEVLVFEQDRLEPAPDPESAARSAFRTNAAHIVQPHIMMGGYRQLLLEYLPDVYEQLLSAGVAEAPLTTQMPPSLSDTTARPGDERFTMLMSRRSTIDWVLQRAVRAQRGVTVRCGVLCRGLLSTRDTPPHVTGLRTSDGDSAADLVIDAAGRRSPIDRWLEDIDAHRTATWQAECGLAYFSRHYRVREGARPPGPLTTRSVIPLDEFIVGIWGADNGAMQLAVGPLAMDHRFKTLRHPHVFTAVLRMLPALAAWLDALDPITEVYAMGGIHNTIRRFVVDGVPVATGVVGIGDSVCTTNPTLGRGLTLASVGAVDLRATLDAFDGDWIGLSHAIDERVADHVLPFYEDQAHIDSARLAALRHAIFGEPLPVPTPQPGDRVDFGQLRAAAAHDPTAFRALWSILAMLTRPADVYADPEIVARTRDVLRQQGTPTPTEQPSREQLLSALAATA